MQVLMCDALVDKKKAKEVTEFIKRIVDFEDEMMRVRMEFNREKIEEKRVDEGDKFYNYDEIQLEKVKEKGDQEEFYKLFK